MNCTYCLVEGLSAVAQPATTAWNGTPVCGSCASRLAAQRQQHEDEAREWTESTRALLTA